MEMQIRVQGNQIRFIYSDQLIGLMAHGQTSTRRVSNVEPEGDKWVADLALVKGPKLGPFTTRSEALNEEVKWLNYHNIPIPE
jgi:hypothetical protein